MSRIITIAGATLLLFVLAGIFVAVAETSKEPPTELYVRTVPPGAKVLVDGKELGASDGLFKVEPGVRRIVVELEGYKPQDKEVTIRASRITRLVLTLNKRPEVVKADGQKRAVAAQPEKGTWGPVIERTVNDDGVRKDMLIDLDSGQLFSVPTDRKARQSPFDWMAEKGIDAGAETSKRAPGLWGAQMIVIPIANGQWDSGTEALHGELREGKPGTPAVMSALGGLPRTYMFATREGGMGVLQIVGLIEKPQGIKIRYKLVQTAKARAQDHQPARGAVPRVVATSPAVGAIDVDSATAEITVTFDRDMGSGFSWTGGGPDYPPARKGKDAFWRDRRTCVLPVKLQPGRYYRVGINSDSFRNFQSADGAPAPPSAIYFATEGASEKVKSRLRKPRIISMYPPNGAKDVDPGLGKIRVTFSVPMGAGFSWTGGGPRFPKVADGKRPHWTDDRTTCVLPVELKPGWDYRLGLNSPSFKNFQSEGGVPLDPVVYTFTTRAFDADKK